MLKYWKEKVAIIKFLCNKMTNITLEFIQELKERCNIGVETGATAVGDQ